MLTKNLQLLKGAVKSCKCFGSMCYNTSTTLDENSDCGDNDGDQKADDDGSANE